jgi:hypothetical protein
VHVPEAAGDEDDFFEAGRRGWGFRGGI